MIEKIKERERAIVLRKLGLSYSEILKRIPVAKSTLSRWLKRVGLAKEQKQRLTKKKLEAIKRGWRARREKRILITEKIKEEAEGEINSISSYELKLIGTALYWAEGHKEKEKGSLVELGNSDSRLIKIFLKWLQEICKIPKEGIHFRIFLHESAKDRLTEIKKYWAKVTNFPTKNFQKISWKRHKISTKRKNIGNNYYGLLRVIVRKSTNLNRRIQGWINGICKNCGVV